MKSELAITPLLRKSLALGQTPRLTVTSRSMAPLLQPGDQVTLTAVSPTALQPGDLITLLDETGFLTHRYWGSQHKEGKLYLLTKGDRVWQLDPPHPAENLLGKVEGSVRQERPFSLTTGTGAWLNRHLTWLETAEYRLIMGQPLQPETWQSEKPVPLSMPHRLLRRCFHTWASVVVWSLHTFKQGFLFSLRPLR